MTLGEKLRTARQKYGLTQEELADKLCVSRQAITKWENDKGIPDIENLKAIAALFDVSVDYLVSDEPLSGRVLRETIDLTTYPGRNRHDAAVRARYPDAALIQPLLRRKKLSRREWWLDFLAPGLLGVADQVGRSGANYIVDLGDRQVLVAVTKDCIESRELGAPFTGRKQVIGGDLYTRVSRAI